MPLSRIPNFVRCFQFRVPSLTGVRCCCMVVAVVLCRLEPRRFTFRWPEDVASKRRSLSSVSHADPVKWLAGSRWSCCLNPSHRYSRVRLKFLVVCNRKRKSFSVPSACPPRWSRSLRKGCLFAELMLMVVVQICSMSDCNGFWSGLKWKIRPANCWRVCGLLPFTRNGFGFA